MPDYVYMNTPIMNNQTRTSQEIRQLRAYSRKGKTGKINKLKGSFYAGLSVEGGTIPTWVSRHAIGLKYSQDFW
jgi:hypothetical protein